MDREQLIEMLNKDLADEHASVVRYLIHAYREGEDTPLGAMMLSISRDEMWHMDWLADEIGEMGAEPEMKQGVYPHDPTSNATLLRSYIVWEEGLVKAYAAQAAQVDAPDIKKVLLQNSRESYVHALFFAAMLEKLGQGAETPIVYEDTGAFTPEMTERLRHEMTDEYRLVLQHLRHSFVFEEDDCPVGSELELTSMKHMKHLSYFAEELAESGHQLEFVHPTLDMSKDISSALESDLKLTEEARERFVELSIHPEMAEHRGLRTNLKMSIFQEEFLAKTLGSLMGGSEEEAPEELEVSEEPEKGHDSDAADGFTIGSLIKQK